MWGDLNALHCITWCECDIKTPSLKWSSWDTVNLLIYGAPYPKSYMFLVSPCSCLCPIHWNQILCREWIYSWSRRHRCSKYIWVINNFIFYQCIFYLKFDGEAKLLQMANNLCSSQWTKGISKPLTPLPVFTMFVNIWYTVIDLQR